MPLKRYCELCKAEFPEGSLSFRFELHVKTVGQEAELTKLATISGEYCGDCVQGGNAQENLVAVFSAWKVAEYNKKKGQATSVPPGET